MPNVKMCGSLKEAVSGCDAVMGLRLQLERMTKGLIPSMGEFAKKFGVNEEVLSWAKKDALLLHPGPVNRNVELSYTVVDGDQSFINEQVTNGVAVRMAAMYLLNQAKRA